MTETSWWAFLLLTALLIVLDAPYGKADLPSVADIYDTRSFSVIRKTEYPHFIMFHAPWCSHCENVTPLWNQFAQQRHKNRSLKVAKIDCAQFTALCASERIRAYPTFRLYSKVNKFTFRGKRNMVEFNHFVDINTPALQSGTVPETDEHADTNNNNNINNNNRPQGVLELTKETFDQQTSDGLTFVDFFAPWCSHCLKLEPIWKQLAERFDHDPRATIAKVDCTAHPELCQQKQIQAYPTLHLYRDGIQISAYNYERSLEALTHFLQSSLDTMTTDKVNEGPASPSSIVVEDILETPLVEEHPDTRGGEGASEGGEGATENGDGLPRLYTNDLKTVKWVDRYQLFGEIEKGYPVLLYLHDPWIPESGNGIRVFEHLARELSAKGTKIVPLFFSCNYDKPLCDKYTTERPALLYFRSARDYVLYTRRMSLSAVIEFVEETSGIPLKDEL